MAWIRGAICAQNQIESVKTQSCKLFDQIVVCNDIDLEEIQAVIFTVTRDIDVAYPAKFVREKYPQLSNCAFLCTQEMTVVGSLANCIRIAVVLRGGNQSGVKHCYLDGAEGLRSDLK